MNQQRHNILRNVGERFFKTPFNVALNIPDLKAILIRKIIHEHCRVVVIEQTRDSQDLIKLILIVHDKKYFHTTGKLGKYSNVFIRVNISLNDPRTYKTSTRRTENLKK